MRRRDQRGLSNSVTVALLLPLALSILFLAMQWSMLAWANATAQAAAQDGARAAAAFEATEESGVAAAQTAVANDSLTGVNIAVTRGSAVTTATVSGQALRVIPLFPVDIDVTATAPTERLTTP